MTSISQVNNLQNQQRTNSTATGSVLSNGDFQTFLTMLTAQIKNQDPLNPMEGTDFAVQLATFSGVEQQVKTNTLLTALAESSILGDLSKYSDWIGREVASSAPASFDGTPLAISVAPPASADTSFLVVKNASGIEVARLPASTTATEITWSGETASGGTLEPGTYSFTVESFKDGSLASTSQGYTTAQVTGAELKSDGVVLTLAGGSYAYAHEIISIR